ncbi:acyl-ACP--UDP-N-acetylglucosamine O-acyltransferase [Methylomagnum ishizawai]|uniref:acyl-ACP--UDP-N-acetylglucosamine O-acyltransferase n=1 Tax=Methylomagnum ishizawai TaxID=1760988 RepID=UPI001C33FE23|nr:acyl-ACP--UDP-N-acetylglucosamine O-acyltransferase [Methylomagnum ishizawai]BBL74525.1 acyl-[acyl-carrier-protein]--UDP-N-acetylglucosam ine O-acyltransferase [Methylomagnum ishizawai]
MIHPTAIIDPSAELAEDVEVGPYSLIGADVRIGAGTRIGPHVVIRGPTVIGRDNRIFQFASIGEDPQDKKYRGETTLLEIGDRNTIREFTTVHRGTAQDRGATRIGHDNLLMAYTHVAHDCVVGNGVIMANAASLAGHVHVDDCAILGGFSLVHQFCQIGQYSFSAMGSVITRDIPPYVMVGGSPTKPHGINSVGLERRGFSPEAIRQIRKAYKAIYKSGLKLEEALQSLIEMSAATPEIQCMADFIQQTGRSILR